MANYDHYLQSKQLTRNDMIRALRQQYKGYSKATQSYVCQPEKYGLCLLPEAETLLVECFGFGEGLDITGSGEYEGKHLASAKKRPNRTKPHCYTVRISAELNAKVLEVMQSMNHKTMQELIEAAMVYYV